MGSLSRQDTGAQASEDRRPHGRLIIFLAVLTLYAALTVGVLAHTPIVDLDVWTKHFHVRVQHRFPGWYGRVQLYELLGQRGPATLVAVPWFVWRAWRTRSPRPLVLLVTALLALNLSVGVVKEITGRIGPMYDWNAHDVFAGGNIFPSGHVSNAVVLYGVIAMLAVQHRRAVAAAAVFLSFTLGLGTVFINTHWLSDVVGGWLAGGLVLIVLPWLMPYTERATAALWARATSARLRRRVRVDAAPTEPSPAPAPRRTAPALSDSIVASPDAGARARVPALASRRASRDVDAE